MRKNGAAMTRASASRFLLSSLHPIFLVFFVLTGIAGAPVPLTHAASFLERAQEYLDEGELNSAAVELKNALQRDPDSAEARFLLGKVLMQLGDSAAAEKELLRARDLGIVSEELELLLASARLEQEQFDEIVTDLPDD